MSYTDERIVKMTFDQEAFNKDIDSTIKNLKMLDDSLNLKNGDKEYKAFDNLSKSADNVSDSMSNVEKTIEKVKNSFGTLQIVGVKVMWDLMDSAKRLGQSLYYSTLGQIKSGGLSRALNLEQAKFQLEGMKVSWDEIKDDINYAVEDTAYGLDAAAKVASQLTASNIKTGNDMKNALRAISGVAAMTNASYEDIGHIFTTVASNGKLMTQNIRSLSSYGLNTTANMIEYFKDIKNMSDVTEQSINDMVSKGKISFMDFANAMDYAFGTHAKEANKTFTGSLSNVKAALSRVGELFETPKINFLISIYNSLINIIKTIQKSLVPIADIYKKILDRVNLWFTSSAKSKAMYDMLINTVISLYTWLFAAYRAADAAGLKFPSLMRGIEGINSAAEKLILTGEKYEKVKHIFTSLFGILNTFKVAVISIKNVLEPIFDFVFNALGTAVKKSDTVTNKLDNFLKILNESMLIVSYFMRLGVEKVLSYLPKVIDIITWSIKGLIAVIVVLLDKIKAITTYIKNMFSAIESSNASTSIDATANRFEKFGSIILNVFTNISNAIKEFKDSISNGLKSLLDGIFKTSKTTEKETKKMSVALKEASFAFGFGSTSNGGVGGGKFMKAAFGMKNGLIDTTKAIEHYKNAAVEASQLNKKLIGLTPPDPKEAYDTITSIFPILKWLDPEFVMGMFNDAFTKLGTLIGKLKEKFSGPMKLLKGGLLVGAIVAGIIIFNKLRDLFSAGRKAGKEAEDTALVMNALSKVLFSMAAVLAVIGLIAKFVDVKKFTSVLKVIFLFGTLIYAILAIRKIYKAAERLRQLILSIQTVLRMRGVIKKTLTQFIEAVSSLFFSLAAVVGVVGGLILVFTVLTKNFDYKVEDFILSAAIIVGSVILLVGAVAAFAIVLQKVVGVTSQSSLSLSRSKDFLTYSTSTIALELNTILFALDMLLISFSLGAIFMARYKPEKTIAASASMVIGSILLIASVCFIMWFAAKKLYKQSSVLDNNFVKEENLRITMAIDTFVKYFNKLMSSINWFITFFTIATKLIVGYSPAQMFSSMAVIMGSVIIVCTIISVMALGIVKASKQLSATPMTDVLMIKIANMILKSMLSFSILALALAGAVAIIGTIDEDKIIPAAITFGIISAVVTAMLVALAFGMKQITDSTLLLSLNPEQMLSINKTLKTIAAIFAEMILGIIAIAGVFAFITKIVSGMNGDTKGILLSVGVLLTAIGSMIIMMIAITELTKIMPSTASVLKLAELLGTVMIFVMSMAGVIKLLSTINWAVFDGSAPYLIGFAISILALISIFALVANAVNAALTGVIGVSVFILALGTLSIMIGYTLKLFVEAIVSLKDAFIDMTKIDADKAKENMLKIKDTIGIFVEAMSKGISVVASALVFSLAMALMGEGMKSLAQINPDTMKYTAEALKAVFSDMKELNNLAVTCLGVSLLFGIIGTSLATGAVGFIIFAGIMYLAMNMIVPIIGKFANAINEASKTFKTLEHVLSPSEMGMLFAGMLQLLAIGAMLGLAGGTLAVSAAAFLVGIGILYFASMVYEKTMNDFKLALNTLSGSELWAMMKDMATLTLLGLFMSLAAGILLGGSIGLLAASAIGLGAAKVLSIFLNELYEAFDGIKIGAIVSGCGELVVASILIGVASGALLLAAIPFVAAMTSFGIGIFMLTSNVAIFALALTGLSNALMTLSKINDETILKAVDTIVIFVKRLNDAMIEASEKFDSVAMNMFGDGLLLFATKISLVALMLPISGLGLLLGAGELYLGAAALRGAFEEMNVAFEVMNVSNVGNFITSLEAFTYALSSFVGDFALYNIPFAAGAALFAAASYLLELGFKYISETVSKYDLKKISKKLEPLTDMSKTMLGFSGYLIISSLLIAAAMIAISLSVSEAVEVMQEATPVIPPFVDAVCYAIDQLAARTEAAKKIGHDIVHGLLVGMFGLLGEAAYLGFETTNVVIEKMQEGADSHSDSKKTIKLGHDIVHGMETGMKEEEDNAVKESENVIDKVMGALGDGLDGAKNWIVDKLSNIGLLGGEGFGSNLFSGAMEWVKKTASGVGGLGGLLGGLFGGGDEVHKLNQQLTGLQRTKSAMQGAGANTEKIDQQIQDVKSKIEDAKREGDLLSKGADWLKETLGLDKLSETMSGGGSVSGAGGYEPTYSTDALNSALTSTGKSAGSGSDLKSARSAGNGVGTSITNNTYNFVQNNYSPEPIDRTELYLQTNNQLNTWYKWLRST